MNLKREMKAWFLFLMLTSHICAVFGRTQVNEIEQNTRNTQSYPCGFKLLTEYKLSWLCRLLFNNVIGQVSVSLKTLAVVSDIKSSDDNEIRRNILW